MGQTSLQRRYSLEEIARRGDEIYEREVLPRLSPADEGKYALIDIEAADYELDQDEIAASDRLFSRHPDAQVWMRQVGSRYARRFGPRLLPAERIRETYEEAVRSRYLWHEFGDLNLIL